MFDCVCVQVKVKLEGSDDGTTIDVVTVGEKEALEVMATTLNYVEKGKVRVKGIFEN